MTCIFCEEKKQYCSKIFNMSFLRSVLKINLLSKKDIFLVCDYEMDKVLSLSLVDNVDSEGFYGNISDNELRLQAARIPMDFNKFMLLTKMALIHGPSDENKFLYSLEKSSEDYVFKWKSVDEEETIINMGCVKVYSRACSCIIGDVFLMLSKELLNLNNKIQSNENSLHESNKKKQEALDLLSVATNAKERLEKELYAKFLLVLNEKKRKIRDLEQGTSNKSSKKVKMVNGKALKKPINHHLISDSSEDSDSHLGNDPGPSTKKHDCSLPFLDDDDDRPVLSITPNKMRNRNINNKNVRNFKEIFTKDVKESKYSASESDDDLLKNL